MTCLQQNADTVTWLTTVLLQLEQSASYLRDKRIEIIFLRFTGILWERLLLLNVQENNIGWKPMRSMPCACPIVWMKCWNIRILHVWGCSQPARWFWHFRYARSAAQPVPPRPEIRCMYIFNNPLSEQYEGNTHGIGVQYVEYVQCKKIIRQQKIASCTDIGRVIFHMLIFFFSAGASSIWFSRR